MIGKHHGQGHFEVTHIDVVPLVDCIMVLLIFLMISSAFVSDPGIEVQRPDVRGVAASEQNNLLIAISAEDRVYFDGQEVALDQVGAAVKRAALGRSPALIIRADRGSSHGVFAAVYSEAKRAGIQQVQFATSRAQ
jgi:biopolymer transport protein ExbD